MVLVFTEGISLRHWRESGMLDREWALYHGLLEDYQQIVVLTYGGADDAEVLASLLRPEDAARVRVVSNDSKLAAAEYTHAAVNRVVEACAGAPDVVVKTNQFAGGDVAVQIVRQLRAAHKPAALIARGGYLWTRFVAYEHGPHSAQADAAAARERVICQAADVVVGTTRDMVDDLAWRYHLDPTRCAVIPNYVLAESDPVAASERDPGLLLYAGQLVPRKRVDVLIQAVASLPDAASRGIRLEIVGDGPSRRGLEALAEELKAPVKFASRVPHRQLLERMAKAAIYVQASELEGHPKTVIEAMSAGTPVLVAKSPGLMDVVTHGMNGLRVDATPDAFGTAIDELLRDEEWRDTLGAAAARTIRRESALPTILNREREMHRLALSHVLQRQVAA